MRGEEQGREGRRAGKGGERLARTGVKGDLRRSAERDARAGSGPAAAARVGSQYLLSGLLKCGVCGKPYSGQGAKSGKFAYYACASLLREGTGSCTGRYLNAEWVEDYIIEKVRERILTEETITELVTLVAEEIDDLAGEVNGRLKAIDAELCDMSTRLENLYQVPETKPVVHRGVVAPDPCL